MQLEIMLLPSTVSEVSIAQVEPFARSIECGRPGYTEHISVKGPLRPGMGKAG
jgi:hypothetical protein